MEICPKMSRKITDPTGTLTASSGELCPCSGEWEIIGSPSTTAVFSKGKLMPEYYGKKVVWMLVTSG
jgi:hypothetical protein